MEGKDVKTWMYIVANVLLDAKLAFDKAKGLIAPCEMDDLFSGIIENSLEILGGNLPLMPVRSFSFWIANEEVASTEKGGAWWRKRSADGSEPCVAIALDPLDNTYAAGGNSVCPFASVITVFEAKDGLKKIRYKDAVASGAMRLDTGDTWLAARGHGAFQNNKKVGSLKFFSYKELVWDHPIFVEGGYRARSLYFISKALVGREGPSLRAPGCSALEMMSVGDGSAYAFLSIAPDGQKAHELGAAYLFLKEADASAINFVTGQDIGNLRYDFDAKVPIIAACTDELALDLRELMMPVVKAESQYVNYNLI